VHRVVIDSSPHHAAHKLTVQKGDLVVLSLIAAAAGTPFGQHHEHQMADDSNLMNNRARHRWADMLEQPDPHTCAECDLQLLWPVVATGQQSSISIIIR